MKERGEFQVRASPPSHMLSLPQSPRREKERKDRNVEIEKRLEWLMKKLANLKKDIKERTKRSGKKKRNEDYPVLARQRSRSGGERSSNTAREVTWSAVVARGNISKVMKNGQPDRTQETSKAVSKQPGRQLKQQQRPAAAKKGDCNAR